MNCVMRVDLAQGPRKKQVEEVIRAHHYAHTIPPYQYCFAAILQRVLDGQVDWEQVVGGALYGPGVNRHSHGPFGLERGHTIELVRFFLLDDLAKWVDNAGTQVIGATLRWLTKNTNRHLAVSYSDPEQGHVGTIYQASNWHYLGAIKKQFDIVLDGQSYQQRSISGKFGTADMGILNDCLGDRISTRPTPGKHKYAYVISSDKWMRKQLSQKLEAMSKTFPNRKGDMNGKAA